MLTTIQPRSGFKLSTIISSFVFLSVILTMIINIIIGYRAEKASLFKNTIEMNRISAGDLSKTAQSLIISMQDSIRVTAQYFSNSELEDDGVLSQLDFFMSTNNYFNSMVVVNTTGTVVSTSPNNLGVIGNQLTSDAAVKSLELKAPYISEPYRAMTNRMIVLVSHPIFDSQGTYKGFVAGTIYLQQPNIFQEILGVQASNTSGSYFYVVDSKGILIYHPDTSRISDNVSHNAVVAQLMAGKTGQQQVVNSEGIRFLAGFAPVPVVGWGVVTQTPESYVASTAKDIIGEMLKFSAPFLTLLLLFTLWLSRKLAEPLHRLANYASRLSRGDDQLVGGLPETVYWNYEANQLNNTVAVAFNRFRQQTAELSQEAKTDALTKLPNRRTLDSITASWVGQGIPFSIIMLDLDHFKSVNDQFGHQKGDEVLQFLTTVMLNEKREQDYCCRYGGEEFTVLLPFAAEQQAFLIAEQIRTKMETLITPIGRPVTLSLGIASYPASTNDLSTLFKQADDALYKAKSEGRNRTVMYSAMLSNSTII
ncbi:MAG: diguanylate cyclase [Candidatus Pristimantibacillus sp.]